MGEISINFLGPDPNDFVARKVRAFTFTPDALLNFGQGS